MDPTFHADDLPADLLTEVQIYKMLDMFTS